MSDWELEHYDFSEVWAYCLFKRERGEWNMDTVDAVVARWHELND